MKIGINLDIKPKFMSKLFFFISFLFSISLFSQEEIEIDFEKLNSKVTVLINNHRKSLKLKEFEKDTFSFYPNPVIDLFFLKSKEFIKVIMFYNSLGQEVLSKKVDGYEISIDLSGLPKGIFSIYFYNNRHFNDNGNKI
jgi:hypothetical protein